MWLFRNCPKTPCLCIVLHYHINSLIKKSVKGLVSSRGEGDESGSDAHSCGFFPYTQHSVRHRGFFTLSSRLFPSLFILLVKLYFHHNYLIATTCLPNRKKPTVCSSGRCLWGGFRNCFLNATLPLTMIPTCGR